MVSVGIRYAGKIFIHIDKVKLRGRERGGRGTGSVARWLAVSTVLSFEGLFLKFYFYVSWCFACRYACAWVSDPGAGEADTCEVLWRWWRLNPDPLAEQPVPLTAQLTLQPCILLFLTEHPYQVACSYCELQLQGTACFLLESMCTCTHPCTYIHRIKRILSCLFVLKKEIRLGGIQHTLSTQVAETGELLWIPGQPGLHS